jgi:hypothetical protein
MPTIQLSDEEIRDAALAARAATLRAALDARVQSNPRIVAALTSGAERYARLSEKFEGAQNHTNQVDVPVLLAAAPVMNVPVMNEKESPLCAESTRFSAEPSLKIHKLTTRLRNLFGHRTVSPRMIPG